MQKPYSIDLPRGASLREAAERILVQRFEFRRWSPDCGTAGDY
jgi:hypothetical protein